MFGLIVSAATALVSGISNGISASEEAEARKKALKAEKERIQQAYEENVKALEDSYAKAKEEAERNAADTKAAADLSDKGLTINEDVISDELNNQVDTLGEQQESDALDWNIYSVQAGQEEGSAEANIANSGIRGGSSLQTAVDLQSALSAAQLQQNEDLQRTSENNALGALINSNRQGMFGIFGERQTNITNRNNAAYLINSYAEGGSNWNIYQDNLTSLKNEKDYNIKMIDNELDSISSTGSFWKGFFGGAASGFSSGYQIGTAFSNGIADYKSKFKTKIGS